MDKIISLKDPQDTSIIAKHDVMSSTCATLVYSRHGKEIPYQLDVVTPSQKFQLSKNRTNYSIDSNVCMNLASEGIYSHICIGDKRYRSLFSSEKAVPIPIDVDFQSLRGYDRCSWTENLSETDEFSEIELGLLSIIGRLNKFADLEKGWDSYKAKPIKRMTITRAINFFSKVLYISLVERKKNFPVPFIAPLADGGIQFEWQTCYKELIHIIPENEKDALEYLLVNKSLYGDKEEEAVALGIDEMVDIAVDWLS